MPFEEVLPEDAVEVLVAAAFPRAVRVVTTLITLAPHSGVAGNGDRLLKQASPSSPYLL